MIEKYRKLPTTVKASIWLIMCNILLKGISFFTAPMFAHLLPTDEFGKMTLFASYEQMIIIFATWEVGLSPFQRGLLKYKDEKDIHKSVVITFGMVATIIVSVIVFIFNKQIGLFTEMSSLLMTVMLIYAFFYTSYVSWMTENKLYFKYKHVSVMTVGMAVVQIACSLVAVLVIDATAEIKMLFTLLPVIVVCFILTLKRFKPFQLLKKQEQVKEQLIFLIRFTWPLVFHSLSYLVLSQADRIMIGKMISNSAAGLYSVSYTIASVVMIVQTAVLQVISPWIYRQMDAKKYAEIHKRIDFFLLIVSVLYIVFILIAPDIIILLYPEYYWKGIWCIPPISIGVYFMFMYSLFVAIEECLDQTKYVALVSVLCSIINVVLNYFGLKKFGYIACAYTTLFCYVLFAAGHYYFMTKVVKQRLGGIKIYNGKVFFLTSVIMICLMIGITFSYNCRIVRYILVSIILFFGILKRKPIISLFNEVNNEQ